MIDYWDTKAKMGMRGVDFTREQFSSSIMTAIGMNNDGFTVWYAVDNTPVSYEFDADGRVVSMSRLSTLRASWPSLNMNEQGISSMTLLSAPFDGNGVGTTWNWVIIDKKEMTPEEVRELGESC